MRTSVLLAASALGLFSATRAKAQGWSGPQAGTITATTGLSFNSATNTFTWTRGTGAATDFLSVPLNSISNAALVGIRGFWIVTPAGGDLVGTSTATNGGFVSHGTTVTQWNTDSSPAGYYGDAGFGSNKDWLPLVSDATSIAVGNPSNPYTSGSYTIPGMSALIASHTAYDIGIDYSVVSGGGTTTGRTYFTAPSFTSTPAGVPEPGALALTASLLPLLGMGLRRRMVKLS